MRVLALETTGDLLSIALHAGILLHEVEEPAERGHAERVLPLLDEARRAVAWGWSDLELLAVSAGPGGYSSVRAGLAVAKAISLATTVPVLGIPTLESLAAAHSGPEPRLSAIDVRHGRAVVQLFTAAGVAAGPFELVDVERIVTLCPPLARIVGAPPLLDRAGVAITERVEAVPRARYAAVAALRRLARGERVMAGKDLRPLYARQPDAMPDAGRPLVARTG